jgi:hypothetical protein
VSDDGAEYVKEGWGHGTSLLDASTEGNGDVIHALRSDETGGGSGVDVGNEGLETWR